VERVIVAMSGGVDSSVAALLLVRAGFDVVGVTLHLWDYPDDQQSGRCCAPEDQYDARRVADAVGFPHFTFDRRELFERHVVTPFVDGYLAGVTPSPCVACNRTVKLRELFPLARRLGATKVATGHYARTSAGEGRAALHRGVDRHKDQSYFLHMLESSEVDRLVLPLGDLTKSEVRQIALDAGLPGATKGESQELCFVAAGQYDRFVEARADGRIRPGPILDSSGAEIGRHAGIHRFTVGQRKGLGVAVGKPAFVTGVDAETGALHVGDEDGLLSDRAILGIDTVFPSGARLPLRADVQVRARHSGAPAELREEPGPDGATRVVVVFDQPVRAISPGQIAVAYDGTRVLGGGTILRAERTRVA
jgi:tRNA-uridine 2-sulfurtransferase